MKINIFKDTIDRKEVSIGKLILLTIQQYPGVMFSTASEIANKKWKEINFYSFSVDHKKEITKHD